MSGLCKLKMVTITAVPEHWAQFAILARSQGLSTSAAIRQLIARELYKAARQK